MRCPFYRPIAVLLAVALLGDVRPFAFAWAPSVSVVRAWTNESTFASQALMSLALNYSAESTFHIHIPFVSRLLKANAPAFRRPDDLISRSVRSFLFVIYRGVQLGYVQRDWYNAVQGFALRTGLVWIAGGNPEDDRSGVLPESPSDAKTAANRAIYLERNWSVFAALINDLVKDDPMRRTIEAIASEARMSADRLFTLRMGWKFPERDDVEGLAGAFGTTAQRLFPGYSMAEKTFDRLLEAGQLPSLAHRRLPGGRRWSDLIEALRNSDGDLSVAAAGVGLSVQELRALVSAYPAIVPLVQSPLYSAKPTAAAREPMTESDPTPQRSMPVRVAKVSAPESDAPSVTALQQIRDRSQALQIANEYKLSYKEVMELSRRHGVGLVQVRQVLDIVRATPGLEIHQAMRQVAILKNPHTGMGYPTTYEAIQAFAAVTSLVRDLRKDFGLAKKVISEELVPMLTTLYIALGDYQDAAVMDSVISELYKIKYIFPEWTNRKVLIRTLRIFVRLAEAQKLNPDAFGLMEDLQEATGEFDTRAGLSFDRALVFARFMVPNYSILAEEWYELFEARMTYPSAARYEGYLEEGGPEEVFASRRKSIKDPIRVWRRTSLKPVEKALREPTRAQTLKSLDRIIEAPDVPADLLIAAILQKVALQENVPIRVKFQSFRGSRQFPSLACVLAPEGGGEVLVHPHFVDYMAQQMRAGSFLFTAMKPGGPTEADFVRSVIYANALHEIRGHLKAGRSVFGHPQAERISVENTGQEWFVPNQAALLWRVFRQLYPDPRLLLQPSLLLEHLMTKAAPVDEFRYLRERGMAVRVVRQILAIDRGYTRRRQALPVYRQQQPSPKQQRRFGSARVQSTNPTQIADEMSEWFPGTPTERQALREGVVDLLRMARLAGVDYRYRSPVDIELVRNLDCLAYRSSDRLVMDADFLIMPGRLRAPLTLLLVAPLTANAFLSGQEAPNAETLTFMDMAYRFAGKHPGGRASILEALAWLHDRGWRTQALEDLLKGVDREIPAWELIAPTRHFAGRQRIRPIDSTGGQWLRRKLTELLVSERTEGSLQAAVDGLPTRQYYNHDFLQLKWMKDVLRIDWSRARSRSLRHSAALLQVTPMALEKFVIESGGIGQRLFIPRQGTRKGDETLLELRHLLGYFTSDLQATLSGPTLSTLIALAVHDVEQNSNLLTGFIVGEELLGSEGMQQLTQGTSAFRQGEWQDVARLAEYLLSYSHAPRRVRKTLHVLASGNKNEIRKLSADLLFDVIGLWTLLSREEAPDSRAAEVLKTRLVRLMARLEWEGPLSLPTDLRAAVGQVASRSLLTRKAADRAALYTKWRGQVDPDVLAMARKDAGSPASWALLLGPASADKKDQQTLARRREALRYLVSVADAATVLPAAQIVIQRSPEESGMPFVSDLSARLGVAVEQLLDATPEPAVKALLRSARQKLIGMEMIHVAKAFEPGIQTLPAEAAAQSVFSRFAKLDLEERRAILMEAFPPESPYVRSLLFTPLDPSMRSLLQASFDRRWFASVLVHQDVDLLVLPMFQFPIQERLKILASVGEVNPAFARDLAVRMEFVRYIFEPGDVRMTFLQDDGSRIPNHYAVLGLPRQASEDDIKQRVRILAKAFSNDFIFGTNKPAAQERLRIFNAAREVLNNDAKKNAYDKIIPANSTYYPKPGSTVYTTTLAPTPRQTPPHNPLQHSA